MREIVTRSEHLPDDLISNSNSFIQQTQQKNQSPCPGRHRHCNLSRELRAGAKRREETRVIFRGNRTLHQIQKPQCHPSHLVLELLELSSPTQE
jgi:hypothetical protein